MSYVAQTRDVLQLHVELPLSLVLPNVPVVPGSSSKFDDSKLAAAANIGAAIARSTIASLIAQSAICQCRMHPMFHPTMHCISASYYALLRAAYLS